jgi:hypothetical protein
MNVPAMVDVTPLGGTAMKKDHDNRQVRNPGPPRDHCVKSSCDQVGVSAEEARKMMQLLGKRAAQHELSHNLKDRPPKFR